MDSEFLHALLHEDTEALKHLLPGKTVLRITGVVHDFRPHGKVPSRIKTAAQPLGQIAQHLFQKTNIVQINGRAKFFRQRKFFRRRVVGGKHDILSPHPHCIAEHQLRIGRTVTAAAALLQDTH